MANERTTDNKKTELSLSAIMFFSPLIQNMLKKNKNISIEDKAFVAGSIKLGYLNIFLLLITIGLQVVFYLTKLGIAQTISTVVMIILAASLVIGSIYAISGKSIFKSSTQNLNNTQDNNSNNIEKNKLENLLNYIPLYNIYLRYKNHNFNYPDFILKESILRWSIFAIMFIVFQDTTINAILISILGIRIIALMNDIDISTAIKQKLNKLFNKNPEELRGYITGAIITIFNKKTISENIITQKLNYGLLFKSTNKQIIFEYAILDLLSIWGLYIGYITDNTALIISILFIAARYLIMLIKRNHLPHIPVIREITNIFFKHKIK